jgi:hypothetical protein
MRIEIECYFTSGIPNREYDEEDEDEIDRDFININHRIFSPEILYKHLPKKLINVKPIVKNGMRTIYEFEFKENIGCLLGFNTIASMAKTQMEVIKETKRFEERLQAEFKKKQIQLPLLSGLVA